jgi:hypothetical protein
LNLIPVHRFYARKAIHALKRLIVVTRMILLSDGLSYGT